MLKYIIAGGSGFVGNALCSLLLRQNHEVIVLSTKIKLPISFHPQLKFVYWNPSEHTIDKKFFCKDAVIVNLAGAGVAEKRWTHLRKQEIVLSRVQSLETLYKAIQSKQIEANYLLSASAIGWYGEGDKNFTEETECDTAYLATVCKQWEIEAMKFKNLNIPVGIARIGIVLGNGAGAFHEFLKPLKFGIAGIPAGGNQIYSWIHLEDLCQALQFLSTNKQQGIYNVVAPNPVTVLSIFNEMVACRKSISLKIPVPAFLLKMIMGEMSVEILKSCIVSSKKLQSLGFEFQFPNIKSCIKQLMC